MQGFVKKYVRYCNTCKHSKCSKFKKQGVLRLLSISDQRWQDISIDFVTDILAFKDANAICKIVDRLSKKRHHIATNKEIDVEKLADLFMYHVWKFHGLPRSIISNRGTQFVNDFWKFWCKDKASAYDCPSHGTPKQMVRPSDSMELWNNTSELTSTTSKTTGLIGYP